MTAGSGIEYIVATGHTLYFAFRSGHNRAALSMGTDIAGNTGQISASHLQTLLRAESMTSRYDNLSPEEMADLAMETVAEDMARPDWRVFVRHYWPAILFASAYPVFGLLMIVGSYFYTSFPADVFVVYCFMGIGRVFFMGNGMPVPDIAFFDETYVETYHVYNSMTGGLDKVTNRDPSRLDLDAILSNLSFNLAIKVACKGLLIAIWVPLDFILQGAHLVHAAAEFRDSRRLSEYRIIRWKKAGIGMLFLALLLGVASTYAVNRLIKHPEMRSAVDQDALGAACAPGRTYIGTWDGQPQAGKIGLRFESLAEPDQHDGRKVTATVFDPDKPDRAKTYQGRIMFHAYVDTPIHLEPADAGKQKPLAPDPALFVEKQHYVPLPMSPRADGTLVVPYADVPITFRPVESK
jgi:hypothetical protein